MHAVCERENGTAVVVFDRVAHPVAGTARVAVQVAEPPGTADTLIRARIDAAAPASALTVVTSDKPLYSYARTRGAAILRTHEWRRRERA